MKLQPLTLTLLFLALLLGGVVYVFEIQGAPQRQATQAQSQQLFTFKAEAVAGITLTTSQQTLVFQRGISSPPSPTAAASAWTVALQGATAKAQTPANQTLVTEFLNLLATGQRGTFASNSTQNTLMVEKARSLEFGFQPPLGTIQVHLQNQTTHILVLGKPNFNRTFVYAQIDPPTPPTPEITLGLVPMELTGFLQRPLAEWQQ
ncbi:hypothetical protein [Neosynechococcus sphagnicola]|uniref:hypothetical protein n=1 Tax=Neosynechococcus sphagnicola TaxID=1501145 RepID=UPI000691A52D|nr:hypothetical protein [Neosynechococcus sphagnicola]